MVTYLPICYITTDMSVCIYFYVIAESVVWIEAYSSLIQLLSSSLFVVIINAFDAFLSLYLLKICLKMFHSSLNLHQQCMEKKEQKQVRGIHKLLNQIISEHTQARQSVICWKLDAKRRNDKCSFHVDSPHALMTIVHYTHQTIKKAIFMFLTCPFSVPLISFIILLQAIHYTSL